MEAVRCSAKKILSNERGGIVAVLSLIATIVGMITYFMLANDQVDKEIRALTGTQSTSYLKADIINTIKTTLQEGAKGNCDATTGNTLRDTYQNLLLSDGASKYELSIRRNPAEDYGTFMDTNKAVLNCFFHPQRYSGSVQFELFKISIQRTSNPNLINLSNYIIMDIIIQKAFEGKKTTDKYQLRYRVDVLSMGHFGIIFNAPNNEDPLVETDPGAFFQVTGPTLVDQVDRDAGFLLSRISDYKSVTYNSTVSVAAPKVSEDSKSVAFMQSENLRRFFKDGVLFDFFKRRNAQPVPWKLSTSQYRDFFNYDVIASGRYPLPKVDSGESAHATSSAGVTHTYNNDKENNPIPGGVDSINRSTASIYQLMYGEKKQIFKSCESVDPSSGVYNLLIFNNLNSDFTIDFSDNKSLTEPPVFCGLIAARNLTIILNDTDTEDKTKEDIVRHHIIGKLLISGKIIVKNKGLLLFTDIIELNQETINPYEAITDYTNVQVQYYNQKYYSSQNFTLPFFKDPSIYNETDYTSGVNRFWVPRDTREFFNKDCSGKKCRISPVGSPESSEKILTDHGNKLLYEVFHVE